MKWLCISYYARIPGSCQAEWNDDRVTALRHLGESVWEVNSICCNVDPSGNSTRVPSLSYADVASELAIIKDNKFHLTLVNKLICKVFQYIGMIPDMFQRYLTNGVGEGRWTWSITSFIFGFFVTLKHRPDIIYTTGGPASAHLSGLLLSKLFGFPIMCEFEDPLSGDGIGRNEKSNRYLTFVEKIILKHATISIYCTRNAAENAKKKYPAANVTYIYPGSPPQNYPKLTSLSGSKRVRFVHLGSLYQTRNFDTLLEAIKVISEKQCDIAQRLVLENVGHLNADIRERLISHSELVKLTPLMSRPQALQYAAGCDYLLLIQNNDERSQSTIPFKIYDYLHLGIPIFGLIGDNTEIREILENHGHIVCNVSSPLSIAEKLVEILIKGDVELKKSVLTSEAAAMQMVRYAKILKLN